MNHTIKIDYDFITEKESGSQLTGYVPLCFRESKNITGAVCYGKSAGNVIGTKVSAIIRGFDLNENNLYEVQQLQLPPDLQIKLIPYILKSKNSVIDSMEENPLVLTGAEVEIIELKKKEYHVKKLIREYNLASRISFHDLPEEAQTVLFSLTFQYGIDALKSTLKDIWVAALSQNWTSIHKLLDHAGIYVSRRKNEAELIKKIIPK